MYNNKVLGTVNNITYTTIQEAVTQSGLFANIDAAENCLQDAIAFCYTAYHLCFLYAQQIVNIPAPALEVWEKYRDELRLPIQNGLPLRIRHPWKP
jgi:hypothetical protein